MDLHGLNAHGLPEITEADVEPSKKGHKDNGLDARFSAGTANPPPDPGNSTVREPPRPSSPPNGLDKSKSTVGELAKAAGLIAARGVSGLVGGALFAGVYGVGSAAFLALAAVALPVITVAALVALPTAAIGAGLGALAGKILQGKDTYVVKTDINDTAKVGAAVGAAVPLLPVIALTGAAELVLTIPKFLLVASVGRASAYCLAFAETGLTGRKAEAPKDIQPQTKADELMTARNKYLMNLGTTCTPLLLILRHLESHPDLSLQE